MAAAQQSDLDTVVSAYDPGVRDRGPTGDPPKNLLRDTESINVSPLQYYLAIWSKYSRDSVASVVVYDERSAMRDRFHWARLLSLVTGLVNQELLLRNEYLAAENRILRAHLH